MPVPMSPPRVEGILPLLRPAAPQVVQHSIATPPLPVVREAPVLQLPPPPIMPNAPQYQYQQIAKLDIPFPQSLDHHFVPASRLAVR